MRKKEREKEEEEDEKEGNGEKRKSGHDGFSGRAAVAIFLHQDGSRQRKGFEKGKTNSRRFPLTSSSLAWVEDAHDSEKRPALFSSRVAHRFEWTARVGTRPRDRWRRKSAREVDPKQSDDPIDRYS